MLFTRDQFKLPAEVTVEITPAKNLSLPYVLKEIHDEVLAQTTALAEEFNNLPEEERPLLGGFEADLDPEWLAAFEAKCAHQEYAAYPDPCRRLSAAITLTLSLNDEEEHAECFWPPFLATAKEALVQLNSSNERVRHEAFRAFFHLREQYIQEWTTRQESGDSNVDFPLASLDIDLESAIPVYHNDWNYRDVRVKVKPIDEYMQRLNYRLSWLEWMCKPGPKLYLNGVPQKYPVEKPRTHTRSGKRYTTQKELQELTVKTRQEALDHARGILERTLDNAAKDIGMYLDMGQMHLTQPQTEGLALARARFEHCQSVLESLKTTQEPT